MARHFHTQDNRLDYGEALKPPQGYDLDFAVGMTYSLDLQAFLSIPVFLSCSEQADDLASQPYQLLESIKKAGNKIALFCNGDGIKSAGSQFAPFFAMIEDCVYPVRMPKDHYFHPKLWAIRYKKENAPDKIRVIVLSRNLTFDNSLDIAVTLEADVIDEHHAENQGLADIIRFTANSVPKKKKRDKVISLADSVMRAGKFDCGGDFNTYRFVPFGIDGHKDEAKVLLGKAYDLIIVSPFLTDSIVTQMAAKTLYKKAIITRMTAANEKVFNAFDGEVWVPKDGILTDELLEDGSASNNERNLHAKIIFRTTQSGNYMYLGSLNASQNAFFKNVEFVLELKYAPRHGGYGTLREDLLPKDDCVFQQLVAPNKEAEAENEEGLCDFSDVVRAVESAKAEPEGDEYRLIIKSKSLESAVEIAPMLKPSAVRELQAETIYSGLKLQELSCFYIVKRGDDKRIIKIQTDGISKERDDILFNSIIKDKKGFLFYMLYLLSNGRTAAVFSQEDFSHLLARGRGDSALQTLVPSLYEKLLQSAAREDNAIEEVSDAADRVAPEMIDDSLKDFIKLVKDAVKKRR